MDNKYQQFIKCFQLPEVEQTVATELYIPYRQKLDFLINLTYICKKMAYFVFSQFSNFCYSLCFYDPPSNVFCALGGALGR